MTPPPYEIEDLEAMSGFIKSEFLSGLSDDGITGLIDEVARETSVTGDELVGPEVGRFHVLMFKLPDLLLKTLQIETSASSDPMSAFATAMARPAVSDQVGVKADHYMAALSILELAEMKAALIEKDQPVSRVRIQQMMIELLMFAELPRAVRSMLPAVGAVGLGLAEAIIKDKKRLAARTGTQYRKEEKLRAEIAARYSAGKWATDVEAAEAISPAIKAPRGGDSFEFVYDTILRSKRPKEQDHDSFDRDVRQRVLAALAQLKKSG